MLVKAEVWTIAKTDQGNAVLVRAVGTDIAVPIFIGQLEAQSILLGLGAVPMPRPLTHDLMLNIFKSAGIKIERAEITDLKDGTFYAQLILNSKGKTLAVDSRPSDTLGLAVRCRCPLYIAEDIIDEAGINTNTITADVNSESSLFSENEELKKQLDKAIEDENYEEAAKLRDIIKKLNNGIDPFPNSH